MDFIIGEIIPLTLRVVKNNKPETGLTMTVRVVDQEDGAEVLTSIAIPETSEPGVYTFLWGSAPLEERELLALFTFGPRTASEFFRIRRRPVAQIIQIAEVEVLQKQLIDVKVLQEQLVNVEVIANEQVDVLITQTNIFVIIEQPTIDVLVNCI